MSGLFDDNDSKRTLGIRDKQILYRTANRRCQNPTCGKEIDFDEMQVGHKIAWSKGGKTTLKNSFCLCYRCNKLQGTDSWATFLKKQGVKDTKTDLKQSLDALSINQLKSLAEKHQIKLKVTMVEGFIDSHRKAPTKKQYINKLSGIVTEKDLNSLPKETSSKAKKREEM